MNTTRLRLIGGLLVTLALWQPATVAQDRRLTVNPAGSAERRRALVVGNNTYSGAPLVNAVNDANAVSASLRRLGFQVDSTLNAGTEQFARVIDQFVNQSQAGDAVVFYYSGHGVQVDGLNYLVPIDFTGTDEIALKFRGINVSEFEQRLERKGVRVRILILDACRDNPFRGSRALGGGLAELSSDGALIAFATAAGRTASDNAGDTNGLFTKYLLEALNRPGATVVEMFRWVRLQVVDASAGRQVPWYHDGLIRDFVFNRADGGSVPAPAPAVAVSGAAPTVPAAAPSAAPVSRPAYAGVGFVNLQQVINLSADGKAGLARMHALRAQPGDNTRALEDLNEQLQREFSGKVQPLLGEIARQKGMRLVFTTNSGIIWADPRTDMTNDTVARLDAARGAPANIRPAGADQVSRVHAFVNLQTLAQRTREGQAATAKINELTQTKTTQMNEQTRALQANEARLRASGSSMSESDRRQLERDIERQRLAQTRLQEDSQRDLQNLQEELQKQFQARLMPVLERMAHERGLHALWSAADSGLGWAEETLDFTEDAVRRMDAGVTGPSASLGLPTRGAEIAFVNLQSIAQKTVEGNSAAARVTALSTKLAADLGEMNKTLQASQQRLSSGGGTLSDSARAQLEREIARQQTAVQRFQEDAQREVTTLQEREQQAFQSRLLPIVEAMGKERGLQFVFNTDTGLIWIEPSLDLTLDAVARMDRTAAR